MADTAKLRQVNVTYDQAEDRLLLKVSTSDGKEFRAWCTRRYTRAVMEQFERLFESSVSLGTSPTFLRSSTATVVDQSRIPSRSGKKACCLPLFVTTRWRAAW